MAALRTTCTSQKRIMPREPGSCYLTASRKLRHRSMGSRLRDPRTWSSRRVGGCQLGPGASWRQRLDAGWEYTFGSTEAHISRRHLACWSKIHTCPRQIRRDSIGSMNETDSRSSVVTAWHMIGVVSRSEGSWERWRGPYWPRRVQVVRSDRAEGSLVDELPRGCERILMWAGYYAFLVVRRSHSRSMVDTDAVVTEEVFHRPLAGPSMKRTRACAAPRKDD